MSWTFPGWIRTALVAVVAVTAGCSAAADPLATRTPGSYREIPATGALDGVVLDDHGVDWFETLCAGMLEMRTILATGPDDVADLGVAEAVAHVRGAYEVIGPRLQTLGEDLAHLPDDLNLDAGAEFTDAVEERLVAAGLVYLEGADTVEDGDWATTEDLGREVTDIEEEVAGIAAERYGLATLHASVRAAAHLQATSCTDIDF